MDKATAILVKKVSSTDWMGNKRVEKADTIGREIQESLTLTTSPKVHRNGMKKSGKHKHTYLSNKHIKVIPKTLD